MSTGIASSFAVTTFSLGYWNCHHHCLPTTLTLIVSAAAGARATSKIVAIVGTAITARITAGMIVHVISSGVLPCTCFTLRG